MIRVAAWLTLTGALAVCPIAAHAGEYAIFSSGQRLHIDRHEFSGDIVRLYSHGGATELPAAAIAGFDKDDYTPPLPAPVSAPQAQPRKPDDPKAMIRAAAARSGLPETFVESVAKVESGFDAKAVSPKGAIGVMQLMPGTAHNLGADPSDPAQNIDAGTRLLRDLLVKYGGDVVKALAAYNAGEGAVDRYQGMPPYGETQQYVNKVVRNYLRESNPPSAESAGQ